MLNMHTSLYHRISLPPAQASLFPFLFCFNVNINPSITCTLNCVCAPILIHYCSQQFIPLAEAFHQPSYCYLTFLHVVCSFRRVRHHVPCLPSLHPTHLFHLPLCVRLCLLSLVCLRASHPVERMHECLRVSVCDFVLDEMLSLLQK